MITLAFFLSLLRECINRKTWHPVGLTDLVIIHTMVSLSMDYILFSIFAEYLLIQGLLL